MGASTADGANVVQYDDWGGNNQQWQFVQNGSGSTYTKPGRLAGFRRRRHHPGRSTATSARVRAGRPASPTAPTGRNFVGLGPAFTLNNAWQFFMGYRFGIFNYATQSLGGAVTVRRFDLTTP